MPTLHPSYTELENIALESPDRLTVGQIRRLLRGGERKAHKPPKQLNPNESVVTITSQVQIAMTDCQLHQVGRPAVRADDGTEVWVTNGRLNRLGGPALVLANGYKFWFIDGVNVTKKAHDAYVAKHGIPMTKKDIEAALGHPVTIISD